MDMFFKEVFGSVSRHISSDSDKVPARCRCLIANYEVVCLLSACKAGVLPGGSP